MLAHIVFSLQELAAFLHVLLSKHLLLHNSQEDKS